LINQGRRPKLGRGTNLDLSLKDLPMKKSSAQEGAEGYRVTGVAGGQQKEKEGKYW